MFGKSFFLFLNEEVKPISSGSFKVVEANCTNYSFWTHIRPTCPEQSSHATHYKSLSACLITSPFLLLHLCKKLRWTITVSHLKPKLISHIFCLHEIEGFYLLKFKIYLRVRILEGFYFIERNWNLKNLELLKTNRPFYNIFKFYFN